MSGSSLDNLSIFVNLFIEVVLLTAMEYIREGDGSGMDELKEEKEESGSERTDDKRRANRQMYWLKIAGEEPSQYKKRTFVSQR